MLVDNANNDIQLMRKCKNLRHVEVLFVDQELVQPGTLDTKSVTQLRQEYRLDGLCGLPAVETIRLRGPSGWIAHLDVLRELAMWLKQDYCALQRASVRVIVTYG